MANTYDMTVGYSPLDRVDQAKLSKLIHTIRLILDIYYKPKEGDLILVAGTGLGHEAMLIHEMYQLKTMGIDINMKSHPNVDVNEDLSLQRQDLQCLAISENVFSMIYCYHVLEHVNDPQATLEELHRVLSPGGILFIGFPNKKRLLSYIGTSQKVSLTKKVQWNLNDYIQRIQGKFENRYGAHAGFSEGEFLEDASRIFSRVYPVRNSYMLRKYAGVKVIIKAIITFRLAEYLFPSNYFICIKA